VKQHRYEIHVAWTGNLGQGTSRYTSYLRNHQISAAGRPVLPGSSDAAFRGDASRYNPEDLLVASLSACHMLSYLHLCAANKVIVVDYVDDAIGVMEETADGGAFTEATLRPVVTISAESDAGKALALHDEAHHNCFIANSVKFPVLHKARISRQETPAASADRRSIGDAAP
jgi:organic hydroperoxide reductase OsmC/OhrA